MDSKWIMDTIEAIAQYGKGQQGMDRQAFTEADRQARQYVTDLMGEIGLTVREDAFGNLIGRLPGKNPEAAAVVTGSHIDTVPEGGKYDGIVGVAGGLYALKELKGRGPLTHPLEVIVFMAEESSRFGFATMGSKVMAGQMNLLSWSKAKDQDGVKLSEALAGWGLDMNKLASAKRAPKEMKAFVEMHIEQGPVLERIGKKVGVVTAIAAPTRMKITVEGFAAHSGTTPMDERQDALVSAARIVLAVRESAMDQVHRGTVGTVGVLKVHPGAMNVVPGMVEMWVDIRGVDHDSIIECLQDIKDQVSTIADEQETPVSIAVMASDKPVILAEEIIDTIEDACDTLNIAYHRMHSGAGHDAMNIAALTPTGMIFVPSHKGISHNPDEYTSEEDIAAGVQVLTETLYQLAK
ncbi:Zn-dependent hydrolase [Acetonema longum]|uniref:Amidase, hydantoinase/carbamoylase family protein n=1 Tax=Acetonema longum DSM 6540 TaxID=1009370 RepID=F7NNI0_9FIRM|nr:Zn-dependent hydrolase [Acetonema longum]EGO62421.1 amidase, hydantoinase/carbamoylase family protein [Acetonema longum DSM 6540]